MSQRSGNLSLNQDLERLVTGGQMLVGTDFDGVLAPIVDHPNLAVPDQRAVELLSEIAASSAADVVIVSGRALADLRERVGEIPGVTYVGEHGNDLGEVSVDDPVIAEALSFISRIAQKAEGAIVEKKPRSLSFHYRNVNPGVAKAYLDRIRDWATEHEVDAIEGKKVIELTTAKRNKGDAMLALAGERPFIYFGDDTTDETVFEALRPGDVGVKVGDGQTAAPHRAKDIGEVVRILEKINLASR